MALTEEGIIHVPGISSQWVRLANGSKAHYVTAGETGPAVVLLHGGLAGSSGMAGWRFMLPVLAANGFRVFAPDRPGYGQADARQEFWPVNGWKSHAEFVGMFVDALGLDRFYIGGNSQGAQNAMYYMVNNPHRIIAAALIATAGLPGMVGVDPSKLVQHSFAYPPFDGTKEAMYTLMTSIIYRAGAVDDDLLEMRTRAGVVQQDALAAFRKGIGTQDPNMLQWNSMKDRLPKLTMPIIYLQGLQDVTLNIENVKQAEPFLPSWQFFYVDECGHQGQTDQPDLFNRVFLEFFRDGKVSREAADQAGISKNRPENPSLVEQKVGAGA
ncbi:MAG: alpha/beta fold hydrolase [Dehalococcoidia bacterium]